MNRPILLAAGLTLGSLALGLAGCHQAEKASTVSKGAKPDDPTAWSDKDVTRGTSDSGAGSSGLAPSSGSKGTWSSEAQDIEKSLGVGR